MKFLKLYEDYSAETFIDWFRSKSGLNLGKRIGKGSFGVVYELDKNRCIKFSDESIGDIKEVMNKNIPYLVKYYSAGLIRVPMKYYDGDGVDIDGVFFNTIREEPLISYIIMERVTINSEKARELFYEMGDESTALRDYMDKSHVNFNFSNIPYNELHLKKLNVLKEYLYNLDNIMFQTEILNDVPNLEQLKLLLKILINIKTHIPNYIDFHADQICFDKNGNVKVVDILSNSNRITKQKAKTYIK